MSLEAWYGILIPFLGTALGSACVFLMKKAMGDRLQRALTVLCPGCSRVLAWHCVFAAFGSPHSPFAPKLCRC